MVAVIKTGTSVQRILSYNENKVKEQVAVCIGAANYPARHDTLTLDMKLNRLVRQNELNDNVTRGSVHISLNFDPSEKGLTNERLMAIATNYMHKIGFGEQPWLAYRHEDAGHPHIHLVTIKVRSDGSRIDMQNIGRNQSEKARREIEVAFGLVKAQGHKKAENLNNVPTSVPKVAYGKVPTLRAISAVVSRVVSHYKYTSLAELNAALRQYNVMADRGEEGSRTFRKKGLLYRALDNEGNKVGVPIKASSLYGKPTLSRIEARFAANEIAKGQHKARLKNSVDSAFGGNTGISIKEMMQQLEKQGIATVLRQNPKGQLYGITYIDHVTKCVFNGSSLGKAYSAKGIMERCTGTVPKEGAVARKSNSNAMPFKPFGHEEDNYIFAKEVQKFIEVLAAPEFSTDYVPRELRGKKKKKRGKGD